MVNVSTILSLIVVKGLEISYICPGVNLTETCHNVVPHVIQKPSGDPLFEDPGCSFPHEEFCWRRKICSVIAAPGIPIEQK